MIEKTPVRMRDLSRSQRQAVRRLFRFYRSRDPFRIESLRIKLDRTEYGVIMFEFWTRRSDCEPNSPRAFYCEAKVYGCIRSRGRIEIHLARDGLREERRQVEKSLRKGRYIPDLSRFVNRENRQ